MHKTFLSVLLVAIGAAQAVAQSQSNDSNIVSHPEINGTIRGKYEYQPQDNKGRFEVRTARVSVKGSATQYVDYKAEIDLCDEGKIKMLDAYAKLKPVKNLGFTIGQMRVPFTIDAHRSPHQQYFANRSFIAKQVGNVRDVGAMVSYNTSIGIPVVIEMGLFNGSGLTNQKDFWTKSVNFSGKLQFALTKTTNLVLSLQKIHPDTCDVIMYNAGINQRFGNLFVEAEYLYKTYAHDLYKDVHAFDVFACYDIPLRKCFFKKISPLARFDYMGDHSDGLRYLNGKENTAGALMTNDYERSRLTAGATFSVGKAFISDIRVNYEQYFYSKGGTAKVSEKNKFVVEFMTHF